MTPSRKRGRLVSSEDEDMHDFRRTRKHTVQSYAESDSESESNTEGRKQNKGNGSDEQNDNSDSQHKTDGTDNDEYTPQQASSRKSVTQRASRQGSRNKIDDDEDEYLEDEEPSGDDDIDDDEDDDDNGHGDFLATDSDESTLPQRSGRHQRNQRLQQRAHARQQARKTRGFEDDFEDDMPTLQDELAELKESESPPPRRKHLRARKEINYQILPPPTADDPIDFGPPAPKRNPAPVKQLFRTGGPFGGADLLSIFGQSNNTGLKAAGGVADSDSSDDEFRAKPGNTVGAAPIKGKKAQLADSDPLGIDTDIDFSVVGGLDSYIDQLKEMVSLPLKYPEVYQRFGVTPPRGVLFHGPPGTGKTLMARALAASCSSEGKKVTFFMRKGADCLSKWVGEAERQLRLLFEEAKNQQPSIIFFDEIDGLAPVRSSKQEQIHASIVSTLLALMDGMDNRGQVIVIGATNRPDSVDSALRRPGRFDREFYFPLPDIEARKKIISIHTRKWDPPLQENFIEHISRATKGYGGADLRALCTEAALAAIQRRYPQIYQSKDKLLIDPSSIHVSARDFMKSIDKIIPSSARSTASNAAPLPTHVEPLLTTVLDELKQKVDNYIPRKKKMTQLEEAMLEDFDDADGGFARIEATREFQTSRVFRPRLLVHGSPGMGQQYLGAAILHHLEGYHIQSFDLGTLFSDSTRSPEAMMIQLLVEVKRHTPSVIFIPNIDTWFATMTPTAKSTFVTFLRDLNPTDSILVLALMESDDLSDPEINSLFGYSSENIHAIKPITAQARENFFKLLIKYIQSKPTDFPDLESRRKRKLEELPIAPVTQEQESTETEQKQRKRKDMQIKNKLKIKLSAIMDPLKTRYKKFKKPIIDPIYLYHFFEPPIQKIPQAYERTDDDMINEVSSGKKYYNMDLDVIEERLWNGYYSEPKQFLHDVKLIHQDSQTFGDRDRLVKSSEMLTNTQVYIDEISTDTQFIVDCQNLRKREKEEHKLLMMRTPTEVIEPNGQDNISSADTLVNHETGTDLAEDLKVSPYFHSNGVTNGHVAPKAEQEEEETQVDVVMEEVPDQVPETKNIILDAENEQHPESNPKPEFDLAPQTDPAPEPEAEAEPEPEPEPELEPEPEPEPDLIIDDDLLIQFRKNLVSKTEDLSVERLEQVNSSLIDLLWNKRHDWNRNHILEVLEIQLDAVVSAIQTSTTMLSNGANEFYS